MWRFIKEVPKAIRQNWSTGSSSLRTAPTVCQEDENDAQKATQVQQQAGRAYHVQRCSQWWKDDHSWQKRDETGDHGPQHHKGWTATNPSHNALEAIALGTVIVLGLHVSKFYDLKCGTDYRKDIDPQQGSVISLYESLTCATIGQSTGCYVRETGSSSTENISCFGSTTGACNEEDETFFKEDFKATELEEICNGDTELLVEDELSSLLRSSDLHGYSKDDQLEQKHENASFNPQTDGQAFEQSSESPVTSDLEKAAREWQSLTEYVKAQTFHQWGLKHMQRQSTRAAFDLWREASVRGYGKAQFNLGLCYELGKGTEKDLKKAAEQYRLAGNSGHKAALYNLALLQLWSSDDLDSDVSVAMSLLETAAEAGLAEAQRELGVLYTESDHKDMVRAAQLFSMAATQKDTKGQYYMGICYEHGWGVVQDMEEAVQMYAAAAAGGHGGALHNLALFHERGLGGLDVDRKAALQLYEKAVKAGNSSSQQSIHRIKGALEEENIKRERVRLQFDGGTRDDRSPTRSRSSPGLSHCSSLGSLSVYIRQNMVDFGITDLDITDPSSLLDVAHSNRVKTLKHSRSADTPFSRVAGGAPLAILDQSPLEGGKAASFFLSDCDEYEDVDDQCSELNNGLPEQYTVPMLKLSGSFSSITVGRHP